MPSAPEADDHDPNGFTPTNIDHEYRPTLCFAPELADDMERVRRQVADASSLSADDNLELQQLDIAAATVFFRELENITWRSVSNIPFNSLVFEITQRL
jgi:hypothetical protein